MHDWDDLRVVLAVARAGTLSAAARELGVNQSTVGRRLGAFEARLAHPVFERAEGRFTPTALGERAIAAIERMEAEAAGLEREITGADVPIEGLLRLWAPEGLAASWLPARLRGLRERHPDLHLELIADDRPAPLTAREAAIALCLGLPTQPDLFVRKLGEVAFAAFASPGYLAVHGLPAVENAGAGFAGHDVIGPTDDAAGRPEWAWFARLARGARPAMRVNDTASMVRAVVAGIGIACLPRFAAADTGLVAIADAPGDTVRELWLAVHREVRHLPRVRAGVDHLSTLVRTDRHVLAGGVA